MDIKWQIVNILFSAVFYLLTLLLFRKRTTALIVSSVIVTSLSVANYYVLLFHGSPVLASDFLSFRTAMNVFSEYQVKIDIIILRILLLFLVEMICVYFFRRNKKNNNIASFTKTILIIIADAVLLWFVFFSPWTLFPSSLVSWSWGSAVNQYGYEITLLNTAYLLNHKYVIPKGYSADKLTKSEENITSKDQYPDVIIILNETLCDLSFYSEIHEGHEVLDPIYKIPGIISGYSTVSLVGGGTNNSEYELLTSNSMSGLAVTAPFQVLSMKNVNSIVSYLKTLGYETVGMHCGNKSNYARNKAYYDLGFDHVYLGKDDFQYFHKYGNRPWMDEDNYKDLIQAYESCEDNPRFIYLLTYQNHGGYEQNDSSYDTVSIDEKAGEYTDDVNEYLTSVSISSDSFCELIAYFQKSERPVIVLMVGDHAPSFIPYLSGHMNTSGLESAVAQRTVPYFVWSNMDINTSVFSERSTITDLIPMLLQSAEYPLTSFYKAIIDLNQIVPIRTYNGICMDSAGRFFTIGESEEYYSEIQYYYSLEYNNLRKGEDYKKELFELDE